MFAGPNGSGKSVLKSYLPKELLGVYLNADEMELTLRRTGSLDLRAFGVETTTGEVLPFFTDHDLLREHGLTGSAKRLQFADGCLVLCGMTVDSYFASVAADFLRAKLLEQRASFTFETVMSHPDKVELLERAQLAGYRTYLYYVATDDPAINISRVQNRVNLNGHDVPPELVEKRYHRSMGLLLEAIRHTDRAYIFDNSTENADHRHTWLAEITEGRTLVLETDRVPSWFRRSVLNNFNPSL